MGNYPSVSGRKEVEKRGIGISRIKENEGINPLIEHDIKVKQGKHTKYVQASPKFLKVKQKARLMI